MNKPNNFSNDKPTQKNHYSIRKFTVGTASIVVHSFSSDRHMLKKARKVILGKEAVGTVNTTGQPRHYKSRPK